MDARLSTTSFMFLSIAVSILATVPLAQTRELAPIQAQQHLYSPFSYSTNQGSLVKVPTSSGLLNGLKHSLNMPGQSVYKFLSVPYAEAPIESLRFQRPVEIKDRSSQTVDATTFGKTCPQYRHLTRFISPLLNVDNEHQTSEDCLHLNVFVPALVGATDNENRLEPTKQLPVIVWIPGEGFDFADARQFDGSYLAHKTQSIVVTVQYRVGVLGFLHAPKLNITGNMGIHDQLMALRWVKRNIAAFGGDSDRVTLMGRFTGSMSISTIITAPKQELLRLDGQMLFNRVALLSGIAVDDWIIDSRQSERTEQLEVQAASKGYCNEDQIKNGTCLQSISAEDLLRISDYGWRLVIDNELVNHMAPVAAIKQNQLAPEIEAILLGETAMEGTLCLYRHMLENQVTSYAQLIEDDRLTTSDLYEIIRYDSQSYFRYNLTELNPIQTALESIVEDSGNFNVEQETGASGLRDKYLNACSSYMIKSHSRRFKRNVLARNLLSANRINPNKKSVEVFQYELTYKPTFSLAPEYVKTAAHGDDVPLIFGLVYNQAKRDISETDLLMTRKMMAYVGNFVHGNNPLLRQHQTIEPKQGSSSQANENETTSMDEREFSFQEGPSYSASSARKSWSNKEDQVDIIDFTESDSNEIINQQSKIPSSHNQRSTDESLMVNIGHTVNNNNNNNKDLVRGNLIKGERQNIRVIVVDNQMVQPLDSQANYLIQSIIDIMGQQQRGQQLEPTNQQADVQPSTKSQRLLELHRQQHILENNLWTQKSQKNQQLITQSAQTSNQLQNGQAPSVTMVNESSFMTMLVFSSCIVILTLMSICLGLCLIIFRHNNNLASKKKTHYINNSSSSCDICEDSENAGMETNRCKDVRGFSNVFAKLKNHNNRSTSNQCTSTKAVPIGQQTTINPTTNMVLHQQRAENHSDN